MRRNTSKYDAMEYQCVLCYWTEGSNDRKEWEAAREKAKAHLKESHGFTEEQIERLGGKLTYALDSSQFSCNTVVYSQGEEPILRRVLQIGRYADDMMYD